MEKLLFKLYLLILCWIKWTEVKGHEIWPPCLFPLGFRYDAYDSNIQFYVKVSSGVDDDVRLNCPKAWNPEDKTDSFIKISMSEPVLLTAIQLQTEPENAGRVNILSISTSYDCVHFKTENYTINYLGAKQSMETVLLNNVQFVTCIVLEPIQFMGDVPALRLELLGCVLSEGDTSSKSLHPVSDERVLNGGRLLKYESSIVLVWLQVHMEQDDYNESDGIKIYYSRSCDDWSEYEALKMNIISVTSENVNTRWVTIELDSPIRAKCFQIVPPTETVIRNLKTNVCMGQMVSKIQPLLSDGKNRKTLITDLSSKDVLNYQKYIDYSSHLADSPAISLKKYVDERKGVSTSQTTGVAKSLKWDTTPPAITHTSTATDSNIAPENITQDSFEDLEKQNSTITSLLLKDIIHPKTKDKLFSNDTSREVTKSPDIKIKDEETIESPIVTVQDKWKTKLQTVTIQDKEIEKSSAVTILDNEVTKLPNIIIQGEKVTQTKNISSEDKEMTKSLNTTIQDKEMTKPPNTTEKDEDLTQSPNVIVEDKDVTQTPKATVEDKEVTKLPNDKSQDKEVTKLPNIPSQDKDVTKLPIDKSLDNNVTKLPNVPSQDNDVTKLPNDKSLDNDVTKLPNDKSQDKEVTKLPNDKSQDKEVTKLPNVPSQNKDVTKLPNVPSQDKDVTKLPNIPSQDNDVTKLPNIPSEDKDVTKLPNIPSEDKDVTKLPNDKSQDKNVTKLPYVPSLNKDVTKLPKDESQDKEVTKLPNVVSEDKKVTESPNITSHDKEVKVTESPNITAIEDPGSTVDVPQTEFSGQPQSSTSRYKEPQLVSHKNGETETQVSESLEMIENTTSGTHLLNTTGTILILNTPIFLKEEVHAINKYKHKLNSTELEEIFNYDQPIYDNNNITQVKVDDYVSENMMPSFLNLSHTTVSNITQNVSLSAKETLQHSATSGPIIVNGNEALSEMELNDNNFTLYHEEHNKSHVKSCGVKGRPEGTRKKRVIGGYHNYPGEWPWLVSMYYLPDFNYTKNSGFKHACGASLIHPRWVLTAGHCFSDELHQGLSNISNWRIMMGLHDLMDENNTYVQMRLIKEVFIFPTYNISLAPLINDIALILLDEPVEITERVSTVCLDSSQTFFNGAKCHISGWGNKHIAAEIYGSRFPISALLSILTLDTCKEMFDRLPDNSSIKPYVIVKEPVLCAQVGPEGQDACQGDSGGPLMCEVNGHWHQVGIVAAGFGCGNENIPALYSRITYFYDWIITTIERQNDKI